MLGQSAVMPKSCLYLPGVYTHTHTQSHVLHTHTPHKYMYANH